MVCMGSREYKAPRGTRDFLPEDMILRKRVIDTISHIYELYGYSPIETPAFESWDMLAAKCGEDMLNQIYSFEDKSGRKLGLRFDLTAPLARVIAQNPTLPKPFKRYCISRVWRYEKQQKGRYREFWQADIDIIGTDKLSADAEVIAIASRCLTALGFSDYIIRINNRKILASLVESIGIEPEKVVDVFRAMDKLDKIGNEGVRSELYERGIHSEITNRIIDFLDIRGEPEYIFEVLEKQDLDIRGKEGIDELREIISYLGIYDIKGRVTVDLSLVRGLGYYTGPISEIFIPEGGVGSVSGGGRYDNLVKTYGGPDLPAVGISLGIERLITIIKERGMYPIEKTVTKLLVVPVHKTLIKDSVKIAEKFRELDIAVEVDLKGRKLSKNFEYANSLGIPYVAVVGPDEIKKNKIRIKDMKTGNQIYVSMADLKTSLRDSGILLY